MPLAASGQMSIGGSTATRSINLELSRAAGATSSLGETALRTLAGVSSGAISISNFYGKANFTVSLAGLFGADGTVYPPGTAYAGIIFNSNATLSVENSNSGVQSAGNWGTPTTTGIGSSYWVKFTQTSNYGIGGLGGGSEYGSPKGTWIQISSNPTFGVQRSTNGLSGATYTVQIASDSGGSNIVATATNISISVEVIF